jgi:uncharacterized metal-binding protein
LSGCSSAAQIANHIAIGLDRRDLAEMSCIVGVGGDVPELVRIAKSGRPIVVLDRCALACVKSCLARLGLVAEHYYLLSYMGARKRYATDFDPVEAGQVFDNIVAVLRPGPVTI